MEMGKSDHRPICLDTDYLAGVAAATPRRERRFNARWLAKETVEEIVRTAWLKAGQQGLGPSAKLKLEAVHNDLHAWDHTVLK